MLCTIPDVVVMKRHILMIEPRTGLRTMLIAGMIAVLLACAGTAAGVDMQIAEAAA